MLRPFWAFLSNIGSASANLNPCPSNAQGHTRKGSTIPSRQSVRAEEYH